MKAVNEIFNEKNARRKAKTMFYRYFTRFYKISFTRVYTMKYGVQGSRIYVAYIFYMYFLKDTFVR